MSVNWRLLTEPFGVADVEWRIQSSGNKDGKVWAMCLAYITARAICQRLDEVFGPGGWKNEYRAGPAGGVLCRIYFKDDNGEWIWREDGAENTDIESVKGGLSSAMKRAGAALGIGRYLYDLDEGWAKVSERGRLKAKTKDGTWFKWDPPDLPRWALPAPAEYTHVGAELVHIPTGAIVENPNDKPASGHDIERLRSVLIELQALFDAMTKDERAAVKKAERLTTKASAPEGNVLAAHHYMVNLLAKLKHPDDLVAQMALVDSMELASV